MRSVEKLEEYPIPGRRPRYLPKPTANGASSGSRLGFVLLLDALGMQGAWAVRDPLELIETWKGLHQFAREGIAEGPMTSIFVGRFFERKSLEWDCQVFSDTIVMTTEVDKLSAGAFAAAGMGASAMLSEGLRQGICFRGAMSAGRLYRGDRVFVGPAIDEAVAWYQSTQWMGVVLTPTAAHLHDELVKLDPGLGLPHFYVRADVPLKNHGSLPGWWAVNWSDSSEASEEIIRPLFMRPPVQPDVGAKYKHTMDFIRAHRGEAYRRLKEWFAEHPGDREGPL